MDPATMAVVAPAAIGATGGFLGQAMANRRRKKELESMQAYNTTMYERQRADATDDWMRQNAYNSPHQQMQRLREAGLNPHLIYGKGADNTAQAMRASSSSNPSSPPDIKSGLTAAMEGAQSAVALASGARMNKAQIDNLYAQRAATDAMTAATLQKTARDKFDLEQASRAKDIVFEQLVRNYQNSIKQGANVDADTDLKKASTDRTKQLTPLEVAKTAQEIANLKVTQELTKTQVEKVVADTQAVIDGNKRANEIQPYTIQLITNQINNLRTDNKLKNVSIEKVQAEIGLLKFDLEFQEQFKKLSTLAQAGYMASMLYKKLQD